METKQHALLGAIKTLNAGTGPVDIHHLLVGLAAWYVFPSFHFA
jgi:hypothetical protein